MLNIGISTSCLYPMETEKALERLAELGARNFEIHFSTFSELEDGYLKEMKKMLRHYGALAYSVHPFYSMLESAMFFSDYSERRFADGLEIYKQYFHAAARIGAEYLVFHGGQKSGKCRVMVSDDAYIERFNTIREVGRSMGVTLLHENVYTHAAESIEFCRKLIEYLGDKALFTFDSKQARRAGCSPVEFAAALGGHIRNIHISDFTPECDCLLPGRGVEKFDALAAAMGEDADTAQWTIEVYRDAFHEEEKLRLSMNYLKMQLGG